MPSLVDAVYQKYRSQNRVYAVMLELTYRCICRCVHCYIDDYESPELTTDEVVNLLDQLKTEGVFDLGLTGGEVFLRKDLETILEEALKRGFITYLLTTGILIDETAADMLKRNKVHHVEISLMGAYAETHDKVMRHPGAFDKTMNAIRLLGDRKIPVVLKNSILRQNVAELAQMASLADSLGLRFTASLSVLPKIGGDADAQGFAVDFETASGLDPKLINGGFIPEEDASKGAMFSCNAGKTICGISPLGDIYPCLIWRRPLGNIREQSLETIWHSGAIPYLQDLRAAKPEDSAECYNCVSKGKCRRCPGFAFSETGDYQAPVLSACALAGKKKQG